MGNNASSPKAASGPSDRPGSQQQQQQQGQSTTPSSSSSTQAGQGQAQQQQQHYQQHQHHTQYQHQQQAQPTRVSGGGGNPVLVQNQRVAAAPPEPSMMHAQGLTGGAVYSTAAQEAAAAVASVSASSTRSGGLGGGGGMPARPTDIKTGLPVDDAPSFATAMTTTTTTTTTAATSTTTMTRSDYDTPEQQPVSPYADSMDVPMLGHNSSLPDVSYLTRPPRLPLPIEEEVHTPGSPIIAPREGGEPVDGLEALDGGGGVGSASGSVGSSGGVGNGNNKEGGGGESSGRLTHRSSTLSSNTVDEDDAEELRVDKTRPTVPTRLEWKRGGDKVYVTGTIFQWNRKQRLQPVEGRPGVFATTVHVLPGTHHIRFLVDGQMVTSRDLPTTVDFGNNLVNYIEVAPGATPPESGKDGSAAAAAAAAAATAASAAASAAAVAKKQQQKEERAQEKQRQRERQQQEAAEWERKERQRQREWQQQQEFQKQMAELELEHEQQHQEQEYQQHLQEERERQGREERERERLAQEEEDKAQLAYQQQRQRMAAFDQQPPPEKPSAIDGTATDGSVELTNRLPKWKNVPPAEAFSKEMPPYLVDYDQPDESPRFLSAMAATELLPMPPSLPGFLGKPILNAATLIKDDNSVLNMPNYTVLNHLATSSIKHNILAVSATTRYKDKFVTNIIYKPTGME